MRRPARAACCVMLLIAVGLSAPTSGPGATTITKVTLKRLGAAPIAGTQVRVQVAIALQHGRFIRRYTLSYGDDTRLRRGAKRPRVLRHTYRRAGRYLVTLTMVDNLRRRTVGRLWIRVRALPVTPALPPVTPALPPPGPAPSQAGRIATGAGHACFVVPPGVIGCVGAGPNGELGTGTIGYSVNPTPVSGISTATAVAAGEHHTCALLSGGTVSCWGNGGSGQLGNGGFASSMTPTPVIGVSNATAIAAGGDHSCALLASGYIQCWGQNISGQLGNGPTPLYTGTPALVAGISNATAIAAGGISGGAGHSCSVLATGHVACWGAGLRGELGDGTAPSSRPAPGLVSDIADATAIATGGSHSCAVRSGGQVSCWGSNTNWQIGNTTTTNALTPTPVAGVANVSAIAAGGADEGTGHTCALVGGGEVWCWGRGGANGQSAISPTPTPVGGITNATAIAAGANRSCALLTPLNYRCWAG